MIGPQRRSSPIVASKGPSRRAVESPLEVMPTYVWNPPAESIEFPHLMSEDVRRDCFGPEGDEDSLLSNAKLTAGIVSSILKDSNLQNMDALLVKEALTLSFKGVISISPSAFVFPSHHCFMLHINFTLFLGRQLPY